MRGESRPAAAFTLIEILLVLVVMGLLTALLVPSVNSLLRATESTSPEHIIGGAMLAARTEALETNRDVRMRFRPESRRLEWGDRGASSKSLSDGQKVDFLSLHVGDAVLVGGELIETKVLTEVHFYRDGTTESFRLRWSAKDAPAKILVVDPWTGALQPARVAYATHVP
jgi:Tfp pilus assembly protein FimT